jgi:hypothetical protein
MPKKKFLAISLYIRQLNLKIHNNNPLDFFHQSKKELSIKNNQIKYGG